MRAEAASNERFQDRQKEGDVRTMNIVAAKGERSRKCFAVVSLLRFRNCGVYGGWAA
jgi:hypothetical protein